MRRCIEHFVLSPPSSSIEFPINSIGERRAPTAATTIPGQGSRNETQHSLTRTTSPNPTPPHLDSLTLPPLRRTETVSYPPTPDSGQETKIRKGGREREKFACLRLRVCKKSLVPPVGRREAWPPTCLATRPSGSTTLLAVVLSFQTARLPPRSRGPGPLEGKQLIRERELCRTRD